jgi:uncharacterized protein YecE (DUF72 family)
VRERLGKIDKKNVYYDDLPEAARDDLWERFRSALGPLRQEGKLGASSFQFPPWVMSRRSNRDHVLECARRLPATPSPSSSATAPGSTRARRAHARVRARARPRQRRRRRAAGLRVEHSRGLGGDHAALAVVRLHGRNRETWEKKGLATAAERFDYRYSSAEMKSLAGPIAELGGRAGTVHVLFNNCYRDHAQANAAELAGMLENR